MQPKSIYPAMHWLFRDGSKGTMPPSTIAVVQNGRAVGSHGSIMTDDNHLIFELSHEYVPHPEQHSILQKNDVPDPEWHGDSIAVLTSSVADYYYHWLFDVIARLHMLEAAGIPYNKLLLNMKGNRPFQQETLALLGIDQSRILTCHEHLHLQAHKLIVPSIVGYLGHMPKWTCRYLRSRFLPYSRKVFGYEKIYIKRKYARHRRVINEDEVAAFLEQRGFRTVVLEELSVVEQMNIFASAEVVVAPHGGGLTNLVFCSPRTKVIEFFAPNYINGLYWVLSNHVDLDYYYLFGEGDHPPDYVYPAYVWEDIQVDMQKLKDTLQLAGI
ncbi:glycosyltransferase family 61 protein [Ectobacillus ponti]|uniref:Glycosyltransferase family 61 protein n=1 Tax=Ectobacillus ponti TaxID=2961894 RepID=A0AA41X418_9BACI|nr:glycosyltransferase family 61 protein [Ectobacillus ponti]MCP8968347.1 glycosyltransferase family 61 protein [Ectobacillus ponti]